MGSSISRAATDCAATARVVWLALAAGLALPGLMIGSTGCRGATKKQPGILLITIDALRPDHLGCNGYGKGTSPNIDRLAGRGILFTQAIAQGGWTIPSVFSALSGSYPSTHGVRFWYQDLPEQIEVLPAALGRAGYRTAFFTSHGALSTHRSLQRVFGAVKGFEPANEEALCDHALGWIRRDRTRPFFLWVHLMDTHSSALKIPQGWLRRDQIDPAELKQLLAAYDRGVRRADRMVGRLARGLTAAGLGQETLVILSADHGEELCEHDLCFHHGNELWDTVVRVPLIISHPGAFSRPLRVSSQVQLIDLAPTIYELVGLAADNVDGHSLLPLLTGSPRREYTAFAEHVEHEADLRRSPWVLTRAIARTRRWKIMVTVSRGPYRAAVFDLQADPGERRPYPLTRAPGGLRAEIKAFIGRRQAPRSRRPTLDEQQRRRLRSLGYIQ